MDQIENRFSHVGNTSKSQNDCYLGLKDLASHCGLSSSTLRSYLNNSSSPLPHFHVGGKILVKKSEFDKWIEAFRFRKRPINLDILVKEIMDSLR